MHMGGFSSRSVLLEECIGKPRIWKRDPWKPQGPVFPQRVFTKSPGTQGAVWRPQPQGSLTLKDSGYDLPVAPTWPGVDVRRMCFSDGWAAFSQAVSTCAISELQFLMGGSFTTWKKAANCVVRNTRQDLRITCEANRLQYELYAQS